MLPFSGAQCLTTDAVGAAALRFYSKADCARQKST